MSGRNVFFIFILSFLIASTAISATIDNKNAPQAVGTVCAACHAIDGNSIISANPKLAGQHADLSVAPFARDLRARPHRAKKAKFLAGVLACCEPKL